MPRRLLGFAALFLASPLGAQGLFPIQGQYRYGLIVWEYGSGCAPLSNLISAELGIVTFVANGTFTSTELQHEVCETGGLSDTPDIGGSTYAVQPDGVLRFSPGTPNEADFYLGRDLRIVTWAQARVGEPPGLGVALRLSAWLTSTVLSGDYHIARLSFANPGTGTTTELWNGTMTFTGSGFMAAYDSKSIDATGMPTFTSLTAMGTFNMQPDGQLSILGLSGAPSLDGAVSGDGNVFFAVDMEGTDVGLLVGAKSPSSATNALLGGTWGGGNASAYFGTTPDLPQFCANSLVASFQPAAPPSPSTFSTIEAEICQDRFGSSAGPGANSGTYSVDPDGATCVFEAGSPLCNPGAVDPSGSFAFTMDMEISAELGLALYVHTPLPTLTYCVGDGSGALCPCLPYSPTAAGAGCLHSFGTGGRLSATGTPSLAADTLVLAGSAMPPNGSALYFQGTTLLNGGYGSAFGDGLRCAGGSVTRLATRMSSAGASAFPSAGDPSVSVRGGVTAPGTRSYQVWYRNAATYCTASTFNLTNGTLVVWGA